MPSKRTERWRKRAQCREEAARR